MDLVLGLSLTSAAVRWVLVEGTTGEGAPVDRGSLDIPAADTMDAPMLLDAVLTPDVLTDRRIHAVGVTGTPAAAAAVTAVLDALAARDQRKVVPVADRDAAAALAGGLVGITDYDDVAVCIVEPDSALVAQVDGGTVTVERIDRPLDGADALELTSSVIVALEGRRPGAIFVIGSDDVDVIVSSFEAITDVPVFSAAEADLALARGAALAAARTIDAGGPQAFGPAARVPWRIGALAMVLAAAVMTFVVSLSVALGLSVAADRPENVRAAAEPTPAPSAPPAAKPKAFVPNAAPKLAMTMVVAAPSAPEPVAAPAYPPPPAYQPPAPVYLPPPPRQEPRLRDRIIERIPIINRFHEPQR